MKTSPRGFLSVNRKGAAAGKAWAGYVVAAVCLLWVIHGVRWGEFLSGVRQMTWWLLAASIALDISSYLIQGVRWSLLLRPLAALPPLRATQAIYAALFVNETLPLRVGEAFRGYLVSQWTSLPFAQVFASILLERLLDGAWTAVAFAAAARATQLPRYLSESEVVLTAGVVLAASLVIYLAARTGQGEPAASVLQANQGAIGGRLRRQIGQLAAAVRQIGSVSTLAGAGVLSGLMLSLQVLSFWLVMRAYGISLPLWNGAAVFLIVRVGTLVPGPPANAGTYQFFTVVGLMLFGVGKTAAAGFSLVVFLVLTLPLWLIGMIAAGGSGLTIGAVRGKTEALMKGPPGTDYTSGASSRSSQSR